MPKDALAINTLRINGVAAVNAANSGHPGIVLGAAPMLHALFAYHLVYDAKHPDWVSRDRFILSAGHGSALLYAMLRLIGLIKVEDLRAFRQLNSLTPGHPERGWTMGVEASTGPLGQGIAMGVGLAVAEAHLNAKFNEVSHYTYVLCGDGDLQEGIAQEAFAFAGKQRLNKLIVLHDSNAVQLDTLVSAVANENLAERFKALQWDYFLVEENNTKAISDAIAAAKVSPRPAFIEVRTVIGEGATKQGTPAVHGAPLGNDFDNVKKHYQWTAGDFDVPPAVLDLYAKTFHQRGANAFSNFSASDGLKTFLGPLPLIDFNSVILKSGDATRAHSGAFIQHLNQHAPQWIGGSADLTSSTKASGGDGVFSFENRKGRNLLFGVREFAMASIANGLAIHSNFRPFVSTFLVFSDYLKPALRLAALMELPVTYVLTHDSVMVGEDGPTHEPIEQLAMMRATPNVSVIRPADGTETRGAYVKTWTSQKKPVVIALTRQGVSELIQTSAQAVTQGAYLLFQGKKPWTLVATGSELANTLAIGKALDYSVASLSNFAGEPQWDTNYAIAIEAGASFGWHKYARYVIGIDEFGRSGPGEAVYAFFGFDKASLTKRITDIVAKVEHADK